MDIKRNRGVLVLRYWHILRGNPGSKGEIPFYGCKILSRKSPAFVEDSELPKQHFPGDRRAVGACCWCEAGAQCVKAKELVLGAADLVLHCRDGSGDSPVAGPQLQNAPDNFTELSYVELLC